MTCAQVVETTVTVNSAFEDSSRETMIFNLHVIYINFIKWTALLRHAQFIKRVDSPSKN